MSPALDMPLNRREAVASLIAMLAMVLGTSDSEGRTFSPESGENLQQYDAPSPAASTEWTGHLFLTSAEPHLPFRQVGMEVVLSWRDGAALALHEPRPLKSVGREPIGSGRLVHALPLGDSGAALLDELSAHADAEWLRYKLEWLEAPYDTCPDCKGNPPKWQTCLTCGRTGRLPVTPDEARQRVTDERAERQAKIDAAVASA